MYEELLIRTGMTKREVKVYATLRSQGELLASQIAKKTNIIRTNTYDILASLIKKGIVSHVIRNNKKYFRAADPEKIIDYINTQKKELEETKEKITTILPKLTPKQFNIQRPSIEVYEGKEGLKTILNLSIKESLRTKKEILGISVQQKKCRDLAGPYHIRWYNERAKYNIKSRYLMSAQEKIIPIKHTTFKTLPKEAKNPNEVFIFGDITTQFFFTKNLFTAIVINNKEITKRYRDYFNFLWKIVKS